jgi:hypothetical protein
MVTLSTADKVLKNLYLDVICEQLNNRTNPFYAAIKKGGEEISGKNAVVVCRYGLNGGMGSATEAGTLPISGGNNYLNLIADLKNIYGTIEVSDKVLRASKDSSSALVNVLNAEMEGLLEAAKFNFSRMLWQTGSGVLAKIGDMTGYGSTLFPVASLINLSEGMIIDFLHGTTLLSAGHRITKIDRTNGVITVSPAVGAGITVAENDVITLQQSSCAEINGIPYLFDPSFTTYYGVSKSALEPILPLTVSIGAELTVDKMQEIWDKIEARSGNDVNMLVTNYAVRRKYLAHLQASRLNVDYMNVDGGFKAVSFNGVPLVADKFCAEDSIFYLNTGDYKLVQLCDWEWIEGENGSILTQLEKSPSYTGTLVKYANLVCTRPFGQGKMTGIA